MVRQLLLLRHGQADSSDRGDDFSRPLLNPGKRDSQRIGVWLATHDKVPDYVVCSPAQRALVSAEKACKAMGLGTATLIEDRQTYTASVDDLYEVIRKIPETSSCAMLVGHNPGLEALLQSLCGVHQQLNTATLAILQINGAWSTLQPGKGKLTITIDPSRLPKRFPWPLMEGREQRKRPAYYYSQSSVIPYRINNGKVEILVIRSSKNKHWVVPKGIDEPGLSAQQSAAKEAQEEAGVEGEVSPQAVGHYEYKIWGACCRVDLYAMRVSRTIPEEDWEESHRTRVWVSPQQAATRVRQEALGPMILALEKQLTNISRR